MADKKEDLKARLARITQRSPVAVSNKPIPMPSPLQEEIEDNNEAEIEQAEKNLTALEAEFEAKKKKLIAEAKKAETVDKEDTLSQFVEELHNDGKFRGELLIQLASLIKVMSNIETKLGKLLGSDA